MNFPAAPKTVPCVPVPKQYHCSTFFRSYVAVSLQARAVRPATPVSAFSHAVVAAKSAAQIPRVSTIILFFPYSPDVLIQVAVPHVRQILSSKAAIVVDS